MPKPTGDPEQADAQALIDRLMDAARQGGPDRVREVIDGGGFDLPAFLRNVEAGWLLLFRHPVVWMRHRRWVRSLQFVGRTPLDTWEALRVAEKNIAVAEFGQRQLDFDERMRLRAIRQSQKLDFWQFRHLLISSAVKCRNGRITLRAPEKRILQVLKGVQKIWILACLYLVVSATLRSLAGACLTCDALAIYVSVPGMVFIWWLIDVFTDQWVNAWRTLKGMA